MKKQNLKKLSLLIVGLLFLTIAPIKVNAATQNDEQILVTQYLTALKNKDVVLASKLSSDARINDEAQYQIWLEEMLQDPNQQIVNFTILDKDIKLENYSTIYAKVEFLNGDVVEVPFRVQNGIVYIDKMDNLPKIKTGIEIPYSEPVPETQVTSWNITLSSSSLVASDTHYTSSFTFNSNSVSLNFRQWADLAAPVTAKFEYAVVKKGVFSDTVYASKTVSGDNSSSAKQITLSLGTGQTFNNLKIRIDNLNNKYTAYGYGEAYCY
ncbi:hypothetical protein H9660_14350 [Clostridium sp. Sa3CUN1]|uniref:Uncharacterized protein n=1 Tax=Clostridium gallinarum TaxID=2762246 RepID=A0ABR8Q7C1_9CLOT|nr:hypothetical protein [Clostridium gallinarum]MBD7916325.1 hypothetical protein [Clostridium gallinarum]